MQNASFPTVLSDRQRRMILPHLTEPAKRGRPRTDPQRIIDAVPYPVESGVQRCLPPLGNREFSAGTIQSERSREAAAAR